MRSISSLIALSVVFSCSPDKQQETAAELRELVELEGALTAVSASPAEDRPMRLADVEALDVKSGRVRKVRTRCVEGYRAFLEASKRMAAARRQVGRIETEAQKVLSGPIDLDASAAEISALHASAVAATAELEKALDRAESKVRECTEMRAALAAELGAE